VYCLFLVLEGYRLTTKKTHSGRDSCCHPPDPTPANYEGLRPSSSSRDNEIYIISNCWNFVTSSQIPCNVEAMESACALENKLYIWDASKMPKLRTLRTSHYLHFSDMCLAYYCVFWVYGDPPPPPFSPRPRHPIICQAYDKCIETFRN